MTQKRKRTAAQKTLLTGIGAGALKATLSDLPKGGIEHVGERAIRRRMNRKSMKGVFTPRAIGRSVMKRGVSRTAGGVAVGAATFPIFLSGVKDIKDGKTQRQRTQGAAKVIGSGLVYAGGKGGVEYVLETVQQRKKVRAKRLANVFKRAFTARAVPGLGAAAITAGTIGYGLRRKSKAKGTDKKKSILPAVMLAGGLTAAAKQFPETVYYKAKGKPSRKVFQKVLKNKKLWVPRVAARGIAGAVGAGILGRITENVLSKNKKR